MGILVEVEKGILVVEGAVEEDTEDTDLGACHKEDTDNPVAEDSPVDSVLVVGEEDTEDSEAGAAVLVVEEGTEAALVGAAVLVALGAALAVPGAALVAPGAAPGHREDTRRILVEVVTGVGAGAWVLV